MGSRAAPGLVRVKTGEVIAFVLGVMLLAACGSGSTASRRTTEASSNCGGAGFLAVSAIRDRAPQQVLDIAAGYIRRFGVHATIERKSSCAKLEAFAYAPKNGWTVVVWPGYFNVADIPVARFVASALNTTVVTSHEYDEDYWTLAVFSDADRIDQFASWPTYFANDAALVRAWRGHPTKVARLLGVPVSVVAPYLVARAHGKAFSGDLYPRDDFWVFTDLWRRFGIAYPGERDRYVRVLRLSPDFLDKLPSSAL
jgi:hypothetical protein